MTEIVRLENVSKEYALGEHRVHALKNVSFSVDAGVVLAIAGPSGSGKSTLLNLIGLIDVATSGRVVVAGQDISGHTPDELADMRQRTIGFIFQTFNLFPVLTAKENVEFPLLQRPTLTRQERNRRAYVALEAVGLTAVANHRPNQLSGGQRQRVAIARALACGPKIVLADEPTANLDHKTGEGILELMKEINRKLHTTFVFSTHDQKVLDFADHYIGMEDGELRFLGLRKENQWLVSDDRRRGDRRRGDRRKAVRLAGETPGVRSAEQ